MGHWPLGSKQKAVFIATSLTLALVGSAQGQNLREYLFQNWQGIQSLATSGDEITLDPSSLASANNVVSVEWSQGLKSRKADYIQTAAALTSRGSGEFLTVFVQKDMADAFLAKCGVGTDNYCKMRVDGDFQYGQSLTASSRFLVFHDKVSTPYIRRFISAKTGSIYNKTGRKLNASLFGSERKTSYRFGGFQYAGRKRSELFGGSTYLSDMKLAPPISLIKDELSRLTSDAQKAEFIDRKSRWCYDRVNETFGKRGELSDGSISDPGKEYMDRCIRWEQSAWIEMSGASRTAVRPEDILKPEKAFQQCLTGVKKAFGHRAKQEIRESRQASYACEIQRKLDMVAIGAKPNSGFDFIPGPALNKFFASGKWRLNK